MISKARMAFVCCHVLIQLLLVYVEYVCKKTCLQHIYPKTVICYY